MALRLFASHSIFKQSNSSPIRQISRSFTVLAVESSADDTCAAIVHSSRRIYSNVVIKQNEVHETYGGIYPYSAIKSHQNNMPYAIRQALDDSGLDLVRDIDGIAFTRGPGMPGCLSVGMNAAKSLAAALGKPVVGVHHMQGHALTPLLTAYPDAPKFPFLTLLISGGHTLLLLVTSETSFRLLATTRDESIGRSFDKISKLLQLKWTKLGPGDALEKFVAETDGSDEPRVPPITGPLANQLAFSFSAHHSHIKSFLQKLGPIENINILKRALAREFQTAAVSHLEDKLLLGLEWCKSNGIAVRYVVVSGGVASNSFLRVRLRTCLIGYEPDMSYSLVFPPPSLCTDNAVMIAWASMHRFLANDTDQYSIDLRPKWSIEDLNY